MSDKADQIAAARRKLLEKRLKKKRDKATTTQSSAESFPTVDDDEPTLATAGQQSMWYVQQIAPDSAVYNMANVMRLEGALNDEWVQTSLNTIVARHEILRTNFKSIDGDLYQVVNPAHPVPLSHQSVTEDSLNQAIYDLIEAPFDLETDALLRAGILQVSDDVSVLVISMHHIISDKWSLEVLIRDELAALYTTLANGDEPTLDPITVQFKDFAAWQTAKAETDQYQSKLAYWTEQLADAPDVLDLPFDKPRPAQQQFEGEVLYHTLPATITEKLQSISHASNATLFMTLMATYMILLHRMSREDDILVGTSVDLRTHSQLERSIGYFLNTVILRQQFDDDLTFREVLEQVKTIQLTAFANKDVEFENLVTHLRPNRDASYNPIFQTMFVMWDANHTEPTIPDLALTTIKLDPNIAKFDLTLYAQVNQDNTLLLAFEYATSLFYSETIERLMQVYETMLDSVIANPDTPIDDLNWTPPDQHQTLLGEWTQTATPFPEEQCLHDLIATHPPEKVAIGYQGEQVNYGDLNRRANQLAHYLIERGVTPNTPVGIMVERSVEMLVGILGILKAGGAYVPIDPAYPDERIGFMLDDSGVSILLTQSHLDTTLSEAIQRIDIDNERAFISLSTSDPDTSVTPDDLAYIIYTSGSTGTPKGVRVSHRNIVHSTTARYQVYENAIDRFLLLSSFAFDSSLVGIFWSLAGGGTLVLPPHGAERDVAQIAALINSERITHLLSLPSLYSILLDFGQSYDLSTLNTVIVAGEACPITLVQQHFKQLPNARLYNEYGPTEGTVWATISEILPDTTHVTIGKAIPNMQTYILDEQGHPVPIGMLGELVIGGVGITEGYHQRPQLTKKRFIDNPFGEGRLYKTGDLVRYLANGEIDFLGRIDRQVKISGYRIEIGEVESAIQQIGSVDDVVVMSHEMNQILQLVGFIVGDVSTENIRQQLRGQLPQYMIPRQLVSVDAIPRTPNGKVDYKQLLADMPTTEANSASTRLAVDDVEQQLVTIWEDLLQITITDTNAEFFALGGYSLLAIRMFAKVNQAFETNLPVSTIFEASTIADLATYLRDDSASYESQMVFTLQAKGNQPALFSFPVHKFGAITYRYIADDLGADRPMYGMTLPQTTDISPDTIEDYAERFVEQLIAEYDAPYYLCGMSTAGLIAYETARQLKARGEDAHVFLFDTFGPEYRNWLSASDALKQRLQVHIQKLLDSDTDQLWYLRELLWRNGYRAQFWGRKLSYRYLERFGLRTPAAETEDERSDEMLDYFDKTDEREEMHRQLTLELDYFATPKPYDGDITLFRATLQPIRAPYTETMGWDHIVNGDINVVHVRGNHSGIVRYPFVQKLVESLRAELHRLDRRFVK